MGKRKLDGEKVMMLVDRLVRAAELLFPGNRSGEEKKAWVIAQVNDRVNIPVLGERTESLIIGFLVDFTVSLYNDIKSRKE